MRLPVDVEVPEEYTVTDFESNSLLSMLYVDNADKLHKAMLPLSETTRGPQLNA